MKKFLLILGAALLFEPVAAAQFTIVTGTVKDANGIAYAGGTISASLAVPGGCTPTLNGVSFTGSMSPIGLDSTGSFTARLADNNVVNCAGTGTTQWKFLVNITGAPPPLGTGPQTCTATLTITGASQSVSASFSACPALSASGVGGSGGMLSNPAGPAIAFYLGNTSNPANTGQTVFTPANVQVVNTCTWSSASTMMTCLDQIQNITGSIASNVATYTYSSPIPSSWAAGNSIIVTGFSGADTFFNQTCTISAISGATFTCPLTHANASSSTNGIASNSNVGPFSATDVTTPQKYFWGFGSSASFNPACSPYQPMPQAAAVTATHLTITAFVNSTQVTLSGNPASTWSAANTGCGIWGNTDDAAAVTLWNFLNAAPACPMVIVQRAYFLFTTAPEFLWDTPRACKNLPSTYPNYNGAASPLGNMVYANGYTVEMGGRGSTTLFFPPDVTGCTHGYQSNALLAVPPEGHFYNFAMTAGGGATATSCAVAMDVGVGHLENFACYGFNSPASVTFGSSTPAGLQLNYWAQVRNIDISACGAIGVRVMGNTNTVNYPIATGQWVHSENSSVNGYNFLIEQNALFKCRDCVGEGSNQSAGINSWSNRGGKLWLIGGGATQMNVSVTGITAYWCNTNAGCELHAEHANFGGNALATTVNGIQCAVACKNFLQDVDVSGAGTGNAIIDVAGSDTYDMGSVRLLAGTLSIAGNFHHRDTGTCVFAAATTCGVTFPRTFGAANPTFLISPINPGTVTFTVTALSATGATITASASNSLSVGWEAVLQ